MGTDVMDQFAANRLEFEAMSVSCVLPSDICLVSDPAPICTQGATRVTVTLTEEKLTVSASPGLVVHTPWYASNTIIQGMTYFFGENYMLPGVLAISTSDNSFFGFNSQAKVEVAIKHWFNDLISGTKLANPGYNPVYDTNPSELMAQLQVKLATTRSGGMPDLTGLQGTLQFKTMDAVSKTSGDGGVEIPGGTDIKLTVSLSGTAADVKAGKVKVSSVVVSSDGIYILRQGERVARITSLTVSNGCAVRLNSCQILSEKIKLASAGVDFWVDFLKVLELGSVHPSKTEVVVLQAEGRLNLTPSDLQVAQGEIERKMTDALRELYQQNYAALQGKMPGGVNLDDVFGTDCRKAP